MNALRSQGPLASAAIAFGVGISPTSASISSRAPIASANGCAVSWHRRSGEETTRVGRKFAGSASSAFGGSPRLAAAQLVEARIVVVAAPRGGRPGVTDQVDAAHAASLKGRGAWATPCQCPLRDSPSSPRGHGRRTPQVWSPSSGGRCDRMMDPSPFGRKPQQRSLRQAQPTWPMVRNGDPSQPDRARQAPGSSAL